MKKPLIIMMALLALIPMAFAQKKLSVDWENSFRVTVIGNGLMDIYQTVQFAKLPYAREDNPLVAPFFRRPELYIPVALGSVYLFDRLGQSIKGKSARIAYYALWGMIEMWVVERNRHTFGTGFPVAWIQFRF